MSYQNKYGRLSIISEPFYKFPNEKSTKKRRFVKVLCDCGNSKDVELDSMVRGVTKSCGCFQKEARFTHGLSKTVLYQTWFDMMNRCYNETRDDFKYWGGKGIVVCKEWHDVKVFFAWALANGYKEGLQLDRERNKGNYEPTNCRFVTQTENARNRDFCVLNPMRVNVIKNLHSIGFSFTKISELYSVSRPTIANVVNGKTWIGC